MRARIILVAALTAILALSSTVAWGFWYLEMSRDLSYKEGQGYVDILDKDDNAVARYVYEDTPKPYVFPLHSPSGKTLTTFQPTGHPHYRGYWVGYGNVNGVDFWNEGENCGKIVQKSLEFDSPNPGYWNISTMNEWIAPDGKVILNEERRYSFLSCEYGILMSTMVTLRSVKNVAVFEPVKEGMFGFCVAPELNVVSGKSIVMTSEEKTGSEANDTKAIWCDYTGEIEGKACGITVFDAPTNLNHPGVWFVDEHGLMAVNPLAPIENENEEEKEKQKPVTLLPGQELRFVYVTLLHDKKLDKETLDKLAFGTVGAGEDDAEERRLKEKAGKIN